MVIAKLMSILRVFKSIGRKEAVAFIAGVLITIIIIMPFTMQPILAYVESEVLYSEDAVVYNQIYNEVFDSLGEAGEDSFLLLETFNITKGDAISIELSYNAASVKVERFVFYKIEDDVILRKITLDEVPSSYVRIADIDGSGVYGIVLFCTHVNSIEDVSISINVMVITI